MSAFFDIDVIELLRQSTHGPLVWRVLPSGDGAAMLALSAFT